MKKSIFYFILCIMMYCFFYVSAQEENDITKEMITFFHKACFYNATDTTTKILQETPEIVDYRDKELNTALHIASLQGNLTICKLLINAHADVNVENEFGYTPLYNAVVSNNPDIVKLLVNYGANYDLRERSYVTSAFLYAIISGKTEIVKYFLSIGAKADLVSIRYAMNENHKDIFEILVQQDGDLNVPRKFFGTTLLHSSIKKADPFYLNTLLRKSPLLNSKDSILGRTALHEAVLKRRTELVKELIDNNANTGIADDLGFTAIDYAEIENYNEIIDYVKSIHKVR